MGLFSSKSEKPGVIADYSVVYRGGLPNHVEEKSGFIDFNIFDDRFELLPTIGSKKWFASLTIPFSQVVDLQVVQRQVGTVEALLGGLNSRQLNQANNIHITYVQEGGRDIVLRLEMMTGFTVMAQARKCQELKDRLRAHQIEQKFRSITGSVGSTVSLDATSVDIPAKLEKLADLLAKGILTQEEFSAKKAELLARM
jgi:hypothetical protein